MNAPPIDALPLWVGLVLTGTAVLGVATDLPRTAPPDAAAAARTIDGVAASEYAAYGEHPLSADAVRVRRGRLALRADGRVARASIEYGPVAPAFGPSLAAVLRGTPPARAFDSPSAFERATRRARERGAWHDAPSRLTVRRVSWRGVHVTLVG